MRFRFLIAAVALAGCSTTAPVDAPEAPSAAEALVQRQLDAYNAHDLEAFIATYSPDAELFDLPDASQPHTQGHAAMSEVYGRMFESSPKLRCEIAKRIVEGPYVIDHEICDLGEAGAPPMRAAAIYQVENGLIRRVWFAFEE